MLLLTVTDDRGAVSRHVANRFPFRIGRSPAADLRLEAAGVWDLHASIQLNSSRRFQLTSEGESLLLLNGESIRDKTLVSGDEFFLGAARISVALAPAEQKSLRLKEAFVWLLLLAVVAVEAVIFMIAG